jgi:pyruvate ferredoxin oxidoreductase beta subunit
MRGFIKVAGSRTVVTGATGCMYVANTSYLTTPWIVPWMHTQLGAGGSSAVGMAAGLRALKRKGKIKDEKINVINFSGDLGAGDMGIGGISAALQSDYDLLIIMYDNESAANTDIQATGLTTYGAQTTFTPPGTACATFPPTDYLNKVQKALAIGGPTFIHTYDPCPKGWDYHPRFSNELGELGIKCGIYPLYEIVDGNIIYTWDARKSGKGRIPVKEFLTKQGRFDHLQEEHFTYIQKMVDEMWEEWEFPGVAPIKGTLKARI